jgi:hypothetical protein
MVSDTVRGFSSCPVLADGPIPIHGTVTANGGGAGGSGGSIFVRAMGALDVTGVLSASRGIEAVGEE